LRLTALQFPTKGRREKSPPSRKRLDSYDVAVPKLNITVGDRTFEQEIDKPEWKAGRLPELDLPLDVKEASREHFVIKKTSSGRWAIKDLDSTNGTIVNGAMIKVTKLKHDDVIQVGRDCRIVFLDPAQKPPPEKSKPAPAKPKAPTPTKRRKTIAPPPKKKGPIVLKSRADKLREEQEEALRRKREKLREEAKAKESEIKAREQAKESGEEEEPAGTFDVDSEATFDRILKNEAHFDAVLAKGEKHVIFGNYRLLKRLSAGGMGFVFKAKHRKKGNTVALKILRTNMVDEQNVARFKQEAWAISAFDHPNIVKVTDLASHGGMYYIAMEFIDGDDLLGVGFKRELTFWQVAEVIHKLADVLRLVHQRNIWHRDIKPQNILMDRKGEIKLIDFGIATVEREKDDATKTADGLIMGTPAFLSPEQAARGKMGEIDGRADLYSLGAVMYYLLTGRRPFSGKSPLEVLKKNMTQKPAHPHTLDEHAPIGLCEICLRLMEKHPDDRYQTAEELQAVIDKWRRSKDGREELERHKKIMKLRERKKKLKAKA
jgi:pSer/pThr/pTyr-binding forkhead associated (FHA) protein/tRNA A-37 threonylcarbamoyl transferase component Bud32